MSGISSSETKSWGSSSRLSMNFTLCLRTAFCITSKLGKPSLSNFLKRNSSLRYIEFGALNSNWYFAVASWLIHYKNKI